MWPHLKMYRNMVDLHTTYFRHICNKVYFTLLSVHLATHLQRKVCWIYWNDISMFMYPLDPRIKKSLKANIGIG